MNKVPKLLKPYYRLNEVFNRLNLVGANLDEESDVKLIAREGLLELSILLPNSPELIKASQVSLLTFDGSFQYEPSESEIFTAINSFQYSDDDIRFEISKNNFPTFLLPRNLGLVSDIEAKLNKVEIFHSDSITNEMIIEISNQMEIERQVALNEDYAYGKYSHWPNFAKPYVISEIKNGYAKPKRYCLATQENCYDFIGLELNDEMYFLCNSMKQEYFTNLVKYRITFNDGSVYWPLHRLAKEIHGYLQREELFVVNKSDLELYEKRYLGIEHDVERGNAPAYLDKGHLDYAKELDIAIQAHTAIFINKEGNPHQSQGERIKSWLIKNYPEESKSDSFLKRISTVVRPKSRVS